MASLEELKKATEVKEVKEPDQESGLEFYEDYDFLNHDPNDAEFYLRKAGLPYEPDKFAYRFCDIVSSRVYNKRLHQGWQPIPQVKRTDDILMKIPHEIKAKTIDSRVEFRKKAFDVSPEADFEKTAEQIGVRTITGHGSRGQGMK